MKTRDFSFQTNGIATILQSPELAAKLVRATNVGTAVEQEPSTQAWFHIPIPSFSGSDTCVNNNCFVSMAWITDISLDIKINENARIDRIHLRDGVDLFSDRPVNYIDTHVKGGYSLTDVERGHKLSGGVAMSIHVAFLTGTPRGRVEFRSAGITVGFKLSN